MRSDGEGAWKILRGRNLDREVVEQDEAKKEENQNDRNGYRDEAQLLEAVPLADGDVGHEDEGGKDTKDKST